MHAAAMYESKIAEKKFFQKKVTLVVVEVVESSCEFSPKSCCTTAALRLLSSADNGDSGWSCCSSWSTSMSGSSTLCV